jgi:hypothetical protein
MVLLTDRSLDHRGTDWMLLLVTLIVFAVATAGSAVKQPLTRVFTAGYAAAAVAVVAYVAIRPSGDVPVIAVLTVTAALTAVAAGWRRGHLEEFSLAAVGALIGVVAITLATTPTDVLPLAAVLATVGLTGFGYGLLPHRGPVALLGIAGCFATTCVLLNDNDVTTLEAYTLPLAALVGAVGIVRWRRAPDTPSWFTVGPALTTALIPSAVTTLDDAGLTRSLYVLIVGAVVLVVAVKVRWQAPMITGATAVILVAVAQLGPYAVGLPRWLSFGVVGVVLLALGARYEARRRNARDALQWVTSLH